MNLLRFRRTLSVLAACIIVWCLYLVRQEGSSLGIWLVIASQCLLLTAMNVEQWRKGKGTPPAV